MASGNGAASGARWRHYEPLELSPILSAALDAFYEHGFHGTTVREIARRVGQTVPSLYYHHQNKEGVFVALLELSTGDVAWRVTEAAAAAPGTLQRFVNIVETIVLYMANRTRLAALDMELRHLSPDNRQRYAARRKEIENLMRGVIEAGVAEDVFVAPHPDETARAILGMCQSIARWYQPTGPVKPRDLVERYVDIALMAAGGQCRQLADRPSHEAAFEH
jgi:AcrR family transcriptional regulator